MWVRSELKERAKETIRKCYWAAVVVCLISAILTSEFGGNSSSGRNNNQTETVFDGGVVDNFQNGINININGFGTGTVNTARTIFQTGIGALALAMTLGILAVTIVIGIVVGGPILVGSKRFFMCSREYKTGVGTIGYAFGSGHLGNVIFVMFMKELQTFLWSLLLIIPGVIKSYEYRMIPYIMAENPEMDKRRAFELSREMMMGEKWNAFVLDLSFILWGFASAFTCGLAGLFWVNPYIAATNAELYAFLRENALRNGMTNTYELPGFWQ